MTNIKTNIAKYHNQIATVLELSKLLITRICTVSDKKII